MVTYAKISPEKKKKRNIRQQMKAHFTTTNQNMAGKRQKPTVHASREAIIQLFLHVFRAQPVSQNSCHSFTHMGHCLILIRCADERLCLHACNVSRIRATQIAVKQQTSFKFSWFLPNERQKKKKKKKKIQKQESFEPCCINFLC